MPGRVLLLLLTLGYFLGLLLFLNGFLLTRRVLLQHSQGTLPSSVPKDFDRVLLVVIDALRYDFIQPSNTSTNRSYLNQMPFVRELLEQRPRQSVLRRLMADPPTTTLQRLKALTTGTLPTFIDLSYNFIGYEIEEDNLLHQLESNVDRRNLSLLGDDTWLALYPHVPFQHLHVYPSFDVHDLDTVDDGILQHLWTVLEETEHDRSSFIIAHFLGVDHCGHRYGPFHQEMKRKLNQMDEVIRNITTVINRWNSSSLLIVIGDHGMTQHGDHGGDELNEVETAMFLHTNRLDYFTQSALPTVSQIDLVPTLSWFLHSSIPFSSLGMMMIDVIPVEQRYAAMKVNFEQMESYLEEISSTLPLSDRLQHLRATLRTVLVSIARERNVTEIEGVFHEFKAELQSHFRRQWSTFNVTRILLGLLIMSMACLVGLSLDFPMFNGGSRIFYLLVICLSVSISFSNSFIINEGMCLYFLLQTIILLMTTTVANKALLSVLLFLTRAFLICREEQQPFCVDPLWLVSKSSEVPNYFLPFISSLTWLFMLFSSCPPSYVLPYLSYLSVIAYWFQMPHALLVFYLSVFVQLGVVVLYDRRRVQALIYSILIFVVGFRFSLVLFVEYLIYSRVFASFDPSIAVLLSLLADYFFYATGHQPVLSQIRWVAAFPTFNSPMHDSLSLLINSLIVRGVFVLCETFSGQIFHVICLRQMLPPRHHSQTLRYLLLLDFVKLLVTAASVFLFRRHLMLWKIFCPRFLFQIVALLIKWLCVLVTIQ